MILHSKRFTPFFRQYFIVCTANLTMLLYGVSAMWSSPMLVKLRDTTDPALSRSITDTEVSWIATIGFIGTILSNFLAAHLQDKTGRKFCLILSNIPRVVCYIILTTTWEPWLVILARFFSGCSDGLLLSVVPVYIAEVSSKEIRGRLGAIQLFSINVGCLFILSAGPYLSYNILNILILCACVATSAALFFLPESPYFMFTKGKNDESKKVLLLLRGTLTVAKEEMAHYEQIANNDEKMSVLEALQSKSFRKGFSIAIIEVGIIFNWTGYAVTNCFLQTILVSTQTNITPEMISAIIGCVMFLSSVAAILINDRFNRKPVVFITLLMVFFGMILLGTFFWITESIEELGLLNLMPLVSLIFIIVGYNSGLGQTMGMLMSELFDGPRRAFGCGCTVFASSLSAFSTSWLFIPLIKSIGSGPTFWIYSCNCLVALFIYIIFIPETKGKSFAEIQAALGKEPIEKSVMIGDV